MKDKYYEIYGDLFDMYLLRWSGSRYMDEWYYESPLLEFRFLRWTAEAIENSISELGLTNRLRPDAKLFLLINFHQLIVLPLTHPGSDLTSAGELPTMIRKDVKHILEYSLNSDEFANKRGEISGSMILRAISKIWDDLSVNKFDVWG